MNADEIRQLLKKYYDAECTNEEEQRLKEYFAGDVVPEEMLYDKEIFRYYAKASDIPEPSADFGERIIASLDEYSRIKEINRRKRFLLSVTGIAAGLAILLGAYFFFGSNSEPRDTYSDPEIAYAEAMKILKDVSGRLNHGTQALEHISMIQNATRKSLEVISEPATVIEHKMRPLGKLNKAIDLIRKSDKE